MTESVSESSLAGPSFASVHVSLLCSDGKSIGAATAFFFLHGDDIWLGTNLHVMTGRNPITGEALQGLAPEQRPKSIRVSYPRFDGHSPLSFDMKLVEDDLSPNYRFHKGIFSKQADDFSRCDHPFPEEMPDVAVIRVPESEVERARCIAYQLGDPAGKLNVTDIVHIVGYPSLASLKAGDPPVWTHGSVATEPSISWRGPRILVDAKTRPGQSGSPVISYRRSVRVESPSGYIDHLPEAVRLVGIYSGRVSPNIGLGSVWTPDCLREAIEDN